MARLTIKQIHIWDLFLCRDLLSASYSYKNQGLCFTSTVDFDICPNKFFKIVLVLQDTGSKVLMGIAKKDDTFLLLAPSQWLPLRSLVYIKIHLFMCKTFNWHTFVLPENDFVSNDLKGPDCSQSGGSWLPDCPDWEWESGSYIFRLDSCRTRSQNDTRRKFLYFSALFYAVDQCNNYTSWHHQVEPQ